MTHEHCQHELSHCTRCDTVQCVKCNQEWGGVCQQAHYPAAPYWSVIPPVPATWWPNYTPPYMTTWVGGTGTITDDNTAAIG